MMKNIHIKQERRPVPISAQCFTKHNKLIEEWIFFKWREVCFHYLVPFLSMPFSHYERVVDHLLLMTYGLKQSLEA